MKQSIRTIIFTMLLGSLFFLLLTFAGNIITGNNQWGFPFWFWKPVCYISVDPVTGNEKGTTSAINYFHLLLDTPIALLPASWIARSWQRQHETRRP